jgi:hypothetical protein
MIFPLAALLAAAVLQPVPLRVEAGEESDEQALVDLCKLPAATLLLHTRSNMLATGVVEALRRCPRAIVEVRLPLLPAHRERFEKLPRLALLLTLHPGESIDALALSALGPRRLHLRVMGPLTAVRAAELARLRDVELELDLTGRVPDAEELARFRALGHADRWLRVPPDASPELIAVLAAVKPTGLVVQSTHNALEPGLLEALIQQRLPTRVLLSWPFSPSALEPLVPLRQLTLQFDLQTLERLPRGLLPALAPVEPSRTPPGHALPEPATPLR